MTLNSLSLYREKLLFSLLLLTTVRGSDDVKYVINYPVKLLQPVTGSSFTGSVVRDHLTCFGNQDFRPATYLEGIYCLSGAAWVYPMYSCQSLWGSRSVSVSVEGSVEIFRMEKLPRESAHALLNASYWLHLDSPRGSYASEIANVDAGPVYLCARSNDWQDHINASRFSLQFRPAYIRGRDRATTMSEILWAALFLVGLSVEWICPFLKAYWAASYTFFYGLNVFILVVTISVMTLLLTPFILTRRNRDRARYAYRLYFSLVKPAEDIELDYRRAWLLFHALYFSSLLVCMGCSATYVAFAYFGFDRETRNNLLRMSMAIAAAAMAYFATRVFDRSSHNVSWALAVWGTSADIRYFINKRSRDEATVAVVVLSFALQALIHWFFSVPQIVRISEVFYLEIYSLQELFGRIFSRRSLMQRDFRSPSRVSSPAGARAAVITGAREFAVPVPLNDCAVQLEYSLLGPLNVNGRCFYVPCDKSRISSTQLAALQGFVESCEVRSTYALCTRDNVASYAHSVTLFPDSSAAAPSVVVSAQSVRNGRSSGTGEKRKKKRRKSHQSAQQVPSMTTCATSVHSLVYLFPHITALEACLDEWKSVVAPDMCSLPQADVLQELCAASPDYSVDIGGARICRLEGLQLTIEVDMTGRCSTDMVISKLASCSLGLDGAELVEERRILSPKCAPPTALVSQFSAMGTFLQVMYTGISCCQHWIDSFDFLSISTIITRNNFMQQNRKPWLNAIYVDMVHSCSALHLSHEITTAAVNAASGITMHLEESAGCTRTVNDGLENLPPVLSFAFAMNTAELTCELMRLSDSDIQRIALRVVEIDSRAVLADRFGVLQYVLSYLLACALTMYISRVIPKQIQERD